MSTSKSIDTNDAISSEIHLPRERLVYLKYFGQQLITRKSMGELQVEIDTSNDLKRALNWYQLIAIGLGGIIGVGIFTFSGQAAAKYAGPSVIISFLISGIVAILSALTFSELVAIMPVSGAAYTYTYAALGEYLAWFIGWNYALLYQLTNLTVVVSWSKHVVHFIDLISDYNATRLVVQSPVIWNTTSDSFVVTGQVMNIPAIAITIGITLLLISGIRPTAIVNLVLVIFKILILLIFIFACCKYVNTNNYKPFVPSNRGSFNQYGVSGMLEACTLVFFSYIGYDSIVTVAQEAKAPVARSLPIALISSVVISLLIYIGICTVMVGLVPYNLLNSDNPLSTAISGTPYGRWLLILLDLGTIADSNPFAMSHDGLLPPLFARIHRKTDTPWISTIINGVICAVLAGVVPVDVIGEATSVSALITYLFVHIDVIVMRYTHRSVQRIFQVPFGRWLIPTVGGILCILLMTRISKYSYYRFLVWTVLGQIVYFSYGFRHSKNRLTKREESISPESVLAETFEDTELKPMDEKSESTADSPTISIEEKDDYIYYF